MFAISCKKQTKSNETVRVERDTIQLSEKKDKTKISMKLHTKVKKELQDWEEYQLVDALISQFYIISNSEALSNAEELSNLVTHLKDSIRDDRLKTPPVIARINVLNNECLRLKDMAGIHAITDEEVSLEIKNILDAYAAFNAKLNSMFLVKDIEEEFELDPDFEKILRDTTITAPINNEHLSQKKPNNN